MVVDGLPLPLGEGGGEGSAEGRWDREGDIELEEDSGVNFIDRAVMAGELSADQVERMRIVHCPVCGVGRLVLAGKTYSGVCADCSEQEDTAGEAEHEG